MTHAALCSPRALLFCRVAWIQELIEDGGEANRLSNPRAHRSYLVTSLSGQSGRTGPTAKLTVYTPYPDNPDCPGS